MKDHNGERSPICVLVSLGAEARESRRGSRNEVLAKSTQTACGKGLLEVKIVPKRLKPSD